MRVLRDLGAYRTTRAAVRKAARGEEKEPLSPRECGIYQMPARDKSFRPGWRSIHGKLSHYHEYEENGRVFLVNTLTGEIIASKTAVWRALSQSRYVVP